MPSARVLQKIKIKLIINIFARLRVIRVGGAEIKTIDRELWFRGAGAGKAKRLSANVREASRIKRMRADRK